MSAPVSPLHKAAPELLSLLKEAMRLVDCYGLVLAPMRGDPNAAVLWYADAKMAIARAEGKTGDAS